MSSRPSSTASLSSMPSATRQARSAKEMPVEAAEADTAGVLFTGRCWALDPPQFSQGPLRQALTSVRLALNAWLNAAVVSQIASVHGENQYAMAAWTGVSGDLFYGFKGGDQSLISVRTSCSSRKIFELAADLKINRWTGFGRTSSSVPLGLSTRTSTSSWRATPRPSSRSFL